MFTFFNSNKKIILFLFNSGLIEFDDIILHNILKEEKMSFKYYLYPEIKNYIDESKQKVNLTLKDNSGLTVLHYAAQSNLFDILKILIFFSY